MAGQRTKLILGDVSAEVALVKTSAESAGPRWEAVTLDVATGKPVIESTAEQVALDDEPVLIGAGVGDGPRAMADAIIAAEDRDARERMGIGVNDEARDRSAITSPLSRAVAPVIPQNPQQAIDRDVAHGHEPQVRAARGVYTEAGEFIDLTALLAEIDEHVKLDGLTVAKSIDSSAIPRDRVRGSFYIEPAGAKADLALSLRVRDLLWTVLSDERRALVVRWTKRTNQALGIVVASKAHDALMLLEVEWGPNMRKPSKRAQRTPGFEPSDAERAAALDFLARTAGPVSTIASIGDERRELQQQAVELAKAEGKVLELPKRSTGADEALAAALTA